MPRDLQKTGVGDGTGPWVQAALFCERVVEDKEGVLTLVRVIDRVVQQAVGPGAPDAMPPFTHNLQLVISLKSDRARGRASITVVPEGPDGLLRAGPSVTVNFQGEERGYNLVANVNFRFDKEGLYWFNVRCDDALLTRVPLRVVYSRLTTTAQSPTVGE